MKKTHDFPYTAGTWVKQDTGLKVKAEIQSIGSYSALHVIFKLGNAWEASGLPPYLRGNWTLEE
jgi:hypothetical protein